MSEYVQGHTASVLRFHGSRNASNSCGYFTEFLKADHSILDVGCGPGSISATLAPMVPKGKVVGIDTGEAAIKAAAAQPNLPSNCTFQIGNAMEIPFADNSFDVVHTSQLLCHMPNPVDAMKEFRRVCKHGGFLACREGDGRSTIFFPNHPGLDLWKELQEKLQAIHGARRDAGSLLVDWALRSGFDENQIRFTAGNMTYALTERETFGHTMATRVKEDQEWRRRVLENGFVDESGIDLVAEGWLAFAKNRASVFSLICGQLVCFK